MQIEGLKEIRVSASETFWHADDQRGWRGIALNVVPGGGAVARLTEGGASPGLEAGETVMMSAFIESVADRVVRAMARLHLRAYDAANAYTAADVEMIRRGYTVTTVHQGDAGSVLPVWMANFGTHWVAVSQKLEGGLPSLKGDPACLVFGVPDGRRVIVHTEDLPSVFRFIESGQLPSLLSQQGDTVVRNPFLKDVVTFH